jgi:hypothetical protein
MSKPILLLSGIPGSGKSSYGRWLVGNKGYIHLDFDQGDIEKHGLAKLFGEFASGRSDQFIAALLKKDAPICLDWGFPPSCLPIVQRLADAGVDAWWFEAEAQLAKKHFLHRGTVSEAAFNEQMTNIDASRGAIMKVFGQHIVHALKPDGTHVSCEEIYAQMVL